MAHVTFEKVRKTYGATVAIPELSLAIASGEFVSLLGPSGCGKTTTLRMLAGLEQVSAGRITIGGRDVSNLAPGERDIAMVFQSYALYPHMTVAENILYPLVKRRVPKEDRSAKLAAVAELLQLEPLLARKPRQLSGGQQQRVALGRALVRDPSVFLLDEPLSNLDAKLRAHMRAELIELHARLRKTMVYVTHDQLEAMTMSDRIAVMKDGALQQFATPSEIYHKPANVFVAGFIGTPAMTLWDSELSSADGGAAVRAGSVMIALPYAAPPGAKPVMVGVRPEDVLIGTGALKATVRLVEPTGHETIVMLDAGGLAVTARVTGETTLRTGDAVAFDLRRDRIHLFDAADGKRIETSRPTAPIEPPRGARLDNRQTLA
jgi:multiple sugar transport system ATP-binding protein